MHIKKLSGSIFVLASALGLGIASLAQPVAAQDAAAAQPAAPTEAEAAFQALDQLNKEHPPKDVPQDQMGTWYEMHLVKICDDAERFMDKYPQDPHHWAVANIFASAAANLGMMGEQRAAKLKDVVAQALDSKDISDKDWAQFKSNQIAKLLNEAYGTETPDLAPIRKEIDALEQRAPDARSLGQLQMQYVGLLQKKDPAAGRARLEELSHSSNEKVAKVAAGSLRVIKARETPVELKFVALDGRKVDMKKMRGKVVLVDFWATWCGPCKAELPNVQAVYDKYHKKGFEVVAVSLDGQKDRKRLEEFVREHKMPWPQFLDEKNERNQIAEDFGIMAIPAPLLFDKKGLLVDENARGEDLEKLVKGLIEG